MKKNPLAGGIMKKSKIVKIYLLAIILTLIFHSHGTAGKGQEVLMNADRLEYSHESNLLQLFGNVSIEFKGITVRGENASFDTATQIGTMTGGIIIEQPGSNLTAKEAKVFYKEEKAVLIGNVHLKTKRNLTGRKSPTPTISTLKAGMVEYYWKLNRGKAEGKVEVMTGGRRIRGDRAFFDGKKNTIQIMGNVRVEQDMGDWLECDRALIDIEKQDVLAEGKVRGTFKFTEKEGVISGIDSGVEMPSPEFPPMEFSDFPEGSIPPPPRPR